MLARLCSNVDFRVRMHVISCVKFLYMRCEKAFGKVLERAVEDVGTVLVDDKYQRFVFQSADCLLKSLIHFGRGGDLKGNLREGRELRDIFLEVI